MTTAAAILRSKADVTVHTSAPTDSVFDAAKLMAEKNIGALLVVERGQVVGIVTDRDYARKVALAGRSPKEMQLREIMSAPVMMVPPDRTSHECMALMTEHRRRHLPVMDGDRLVGVISIGDLVRDIVSEQTFIIAQLESYIRG